MTLPRPVRPYLYAITRDLTTWARARQTNRAAVCGVCRKEH